MQKIYAQEFGLVIEVHVLLKRYIGSNFISFLFFCHSTTSYSSSPLVIFVFCSNTCIIIINSSFQFVLTMHFSDLSLLHLLAQEYKALIDHVVLNSIPQNVDDLSSCQSDDYISERNDDIDDIEDQIEVLGEEMIMVLLSSL